MSPPPRRRHALEVAFVAYVGGEIDSAAGAPAPAEQQYSAAIELARSSGATFIVNIASVGLLTVLVDAGRVEDALRGYREVVDYFASTGNRSHLWTTLRNLARLLRTLGDEETAGPARAVRRVHARHHLPAGHRPGRDGTARPGAGVVAAGTAGRRRGRARAAGGRAVDSAGGRVGRKPVPAAPAGRPVRRLLVGDARHRRRAGRVAPHRSRWYPSTVAPARTR